MGVKNSQNLRTVYYSVNFKPLTLNFLNWSKRQTLFRTVPSRETQLNEHWKR